MSWVGPYDLLICLTSWAALPPLVLAAKIPAVLVALPALPAVQPILLVVVLLTVLVEHQLTVQLLARNRIFLALSCRRMRRRRWRRRRGVPVTCTSRWGTASWGTFHTHVPFVSYFLFLICYFTGVCFFLSCFTLAFPMLEVSCTFTHRPPLPGCADGVRAGGAVAAPLPAGAAARCYALLCHQKDK